jgi:ABC-type uncharacterized transport system involved in gliding motility auxiliary subunit
LKNLASYAGAAGTGLLVAAALLRLVQPGRADLALSFAIGGLALEALFLTSHREAISRLFALRSTKEGANAVVLVLLVAGIVVAVNVIAGWHHEQWDFTAARQHSLSDQTTRVLESLPADVEIVLFDNPGSARAAAAREILNLYDDASERVRAFVIDPEAQPGRALEYQAPGDPGLDMGTVLVVTGGKTERATAASEPEITNALLRALKTERKKIYFTAGHDEKSLDETNAELGLSVMKGKLEASTYDTETLVIARSLVGNELQIPEDAAALIVAGPRTDFLADELAAIGRYLSSGGKAVFLVDPKSQGRTDALTGFLSERGVALEDDVVVDPFSAPPLYPVVRSYGRHPIVESFSNVLTVFPLARSVARTESVPPGSEIRELFETEAESWSETRIEELERRGGPANDQKQGPLALAVAVTITPDSAGTETSEARLVVVGDSDFISNQLASAPVRNADLFLNIVNWVAQDEDLISIRPREPEDRRVFLSATGMRNVIVLSLVVLPGVVFLTGISVWWGRR